MKDKNLLFINLLPLKTNRLIIKQTSCIDIDLILKMDKKEETQKFLGGIKNKTKEERIEFLSKKESKFKEGIASSLTVYLNEIPIGFVGLKIQEDIAEISYIFDYDYWNKGYCTETCNKLIEVVFNNLNLKMIYANTLENNINSIKVLNKLGFSYKEKILKDNTIFLNYQINKI